MSNVIKLSDYCKAKAEELHSLRMAARDAVIACTNAGDEDGVVDAMLDYNTLSAVEHDLRRRRRQYERGSLHAVDQKGSVSYSLGPPNLEYPPNATVNFTESTE